MTFTGVTAGECCEIVGLEAEHVAGGMKADLPPPSGSSLLILTTPEMTL
jgi:hypothetical protein